MKTYHNIRTTTLFYFVAKIFRAWFPEVLDEVHLFATQELEFWRDQEAIEQEHNSNDGVEEARRFREAYYLLMKFTDIYEPSYTGILEFKTHIKDARIDWEHTPIFLKREVQYPHWDGPLIAAAILDWNEHLDEVRWQNQYSTQGHYMRCGSADFQKWVKCYQATLTERK